MIDLERIDLSGEVPAEEPQRQYYYMAELKRIVERLSREEGRRLTACVVTFGCQMNASPAYRRAPGTQQVLYKYLLAKNSYQSIIKTSTAQ